MDVRGVGMYLAINAEVSVLHFICFRFLHMEGKNSHNKVCRSKEEMMFQMLL